MSSPDLSVEAALSPSFCCWPHEEREDRLILEMIALEWIRGTPNNQRREGRSACNRHRAAPAQPNQPAGACELGLDSREHRWGGGDLSLCLSESIAVGQLEVDSSAVL